VVEDAAVRGLERDAKAPLALAQRGLGGARRRDVAREAARVDELAGLPERAHAEHHGLDRAVLAEEARFLVVDPPAREQAFEDRQDDLLLEMEVGDRPPDVLVAAVAQHVELGLVGAYDDPVRVHAVQADGSIVEEVDELLLAALDRLHLVAHLVLPAPRADRGAQRAHQGAQPDRTLEHGHVADLFERAHRVGQTRARCREQQDRHVGPRGLRAQHREEVHDARVADERLVGEEQRTGLVRPAGQLLEAGGDAAADVGLAQQGFGQRRVLRRRCEERDPLVVRARDRTHRSPGRGRRCRSRRAGECRRGRPAARAAARRARCRRRAAARESCARAGRCAS
jgi:hypothetical protein